MANQTYQDVEAVAALAEALAEADGLGEAFRRSDLFSIDGVWLRYSQKAHGVLDAVQALRWTLTRL